MSAPVEFHEVPPSCSAVLAEVNSRTGHAHRWQRQLEGGDQGGAHLVVEDDRLAVLTWEPPGWRSDQLLRAFPLVVQAVEAGWPAARWLAAGPLSGGRAFVLQDHVEGVPMSVMDVGTVEAVLTANAKQAGLGTEDAPDDSAQLERVLRGDHPWRMHVARCTAAGAALVEHGDEVLAWAGEVPIPTSDVIHGDYSSSNILLGPEESPVTFVDCQTIGRGSRVRDLADLYRQSFVYPSAGHTGAHLVREVATAIEGPRVFAKCAVAVTYNNLAWWAENKPAAEFDRACADLHRLFDDVGRPNS